MTNQKEKAKRYVSEWNKFRESFEGNFTRMELRDLAAKHKLPYRNDMTAMIVRDESVVRKIGEKKGKRNTTVDFFEFNGKPIHWTLMAEAISNGKVARRGSNNVGQSELAPIDKNTDLPEFISDSTTFKSVVEYFVNAGVESISLNFKTK